MPPVVQSLYKMSIAALAMIGVQNIDYPETINFEELDIARPTMNRVDSDLKRLKKKPGRYVFQYYQRSPQDFRIYFGYEAKV